MLKPNSFVISGTQGLKNFVVRAEASGGEVRGITILYDQATAGIMAPVAIAMANSFEGFPDPNAAPPPGQQRAVEYGTAIVVDQKRRSHHRSGRSRPNARPSRWPGFRSCRAHRRGQDQRSRADPALWRAQSRAGGARRRQPRRRSHPRRHRRPAGAGRRRRGDKRGGASQRASPRAGAEASASPARRRSMRKAVLPEWSS